MRSQAVPVAIRRLRAWIEADPRDPSILLTEYGRGWRLVCNPPPAESPPTPTLLGRSTVLPSVGAGWEQGDLQVIVGPGGVGKTTLARAAMPPGAVFVDLQEATTGAQCLEMIRRAVPGLQLDHSTPAAATERIRYRLTPLPLTVLDDAEQVIEPLADLVTHLAGARILVTSVCRSVCPESASSSWSRSPLMTRWSFCGVGLPRPVERARCPTRPCSMWSSASTACRSRSSWSLPAHGYCPWTIW